MSSFRRILYNRRRLTSPSVTLQNTLLHPNPGKANFLEEHFPSPDINKKGFLRRFLHRNAITQLPEILSLPVGEKLRDKLKGINKSGERIQLEGLAPPAPGNFSGVVGVGISVEDMRKLMRVSLFEKVKKKLRDVKVSSVPYKEFVEFCVEECGSEEKGVEFANELDQCGNVVVLGNVVFLRTDELAKSMENILSQLMPIPNDPRRKELEELEEEKARIDQKARTQVQNELYCGLGFLLLQTIGFMRLTFWELSWDVMEPICFFVTSLHFALAYAFFLRTSTEPSFEGYFQRRFRTKQYKLIKLHNFDIHKYSQLRMAFYPNLEFGIPLPKHC